MLRCAEKCPENSTGANHCFTDKPGRHLEAPLEQLVSFGNYPLGKIPIGQGAGQSENEELFGARIHLHFVSALSEGYDLIVVANPTHLYLECALEAFRDGRKVYLEKTVLHNLAGIEALLKA